MKYLKRFEGFGNFFKRKSENKVRLEEQKHKNVEILRLIFNMEPDIKIHEGDFKTHTWMRKGDLVPGDDRNDLLITDWAGMSVMFDMVNMNYILQLPVKYSSSYKYRVKSLIETKFKISDFRISESGTMTIKFTE